MSAPKQQPAAETRTCARDGCTETFTRWRSANQRYCSGSCAELARYAQRYGPRASREERTRICAREDCGRAFVVGTLRSTQRHCQLGCSNYTRRRRTREEASQT